MSKWSDGAELIQKLMTAKEVIPVQGDLIALQQTMFSLQAEQMKLIDENAQLRKKVSDLEKKKSYSYEDGHTWKVHPDRADIKLCPICLDRDGFENPTIPNGGRQYCYTCQKAFK